jgi:hypothetical protein
MRGIPSRRRACLEAGLGQWARWSTARDERPWPAGLGLYARGVGATGYLRTGVIIIFAPGRRDHVSGTARVWRVFASG